MNRELIHNTWSVTRVVLARFRFVAVFVVAGLIVGYWDTIRNYWDRWTRPEAVMVDSDTEYYCAMHPNVVRSEPGSCPICAMPLIERKKGQVMELPEDVLARVQLTPQRIALAGVKTTPVTARPLVRDIHTVGILDYNETRVAQLSVRVGGRADELFLQYTGQSVERGDPVFSLYSPELYAAQREYLLARQRVNQLPPNATADARADAIAVYNATLEKLVLWGVTRDQLDRMDQEFDASGKIPSHLTITSPISGIVIRKAIYEGAYVNVGDTPYTIADLSTLWLQAKIYERDVPLVRVGQAVEVTVEAFPGEVFKGTVTFRSFQVDPATRTLDARVEVANPDLRLRPGMFANAALKVPVVPVEPATQPGEHHHVASADERAEALEAALPPYLEVQTLLAGDQADGVTDRLNQIRAALEPIREDDELSAAYRQVADAASASEGRALKAIREQFKNVSLAMIQIGKAAGLTDSAVTVQIYHCPMAKASWLQPPGETANPYYGSEMLTCGGPVEPLPKASAIVPAAPKADVPAGMVLSIPRSAVIDTGRHKIVYVESSPGVFDMRAVQLGALAEGYYPVLGGLSEHERVVTAGAFLIDAENRLNPMPTAEAGHSH